jgi:hypothetical protein
VLRTLLIGPLRFTPIVEARRRGDAFEGTIALDRLLSGVVDLPLITRANVASPKGPNPFHVVGSAIEWRGVVLI